MRIAVALAMPLAVALALPSAGSAAAGCASGQRAATRGDAALYQDRASGRTVLKSCYRSRPRYRASFGEPLRRVVLASNGAFAVEFGDRIVTVDADDRRLADRGAGVVAGSLRAGEHRFRWTDTSGPLPGPRTRRARSRPSPSCLGMRTVQESEAVRVVERDRLVIACLRRDLAHGIVLADHRQGDGDKGGPVAYPYVGGSFVAVLTEHYDPEYYAIDCELELLELTSERHLLAGHYVGAPAADDAYRECQDVQVRVSPIGALAWIARGEPKLGDFGEKTGFRVRAWTLTAGAVLLDAASRIDGTSLSIDGSLVRWTRDGAPRSADLAALPPGVAGSAGARR